ncbi:MAG: GNAT family N-acetyltransferase [Rubrobacter sp.]|nr:GNAT family N-acetyltransferase [Rubrobacter sp.]
MERERSERFFVDLPETETERLLLRKVTLDDAEDLLAYVSDPEVARHTTWEPYDSIEEVRDFLGSVISNYECGEPANWGVTLRESDRLIGMCGFVDSRVCAPHNCDCFYLWLTSATFTDAQRRRSRHASRSLPDTISCVPAGPSVATAVADRVRPARIKYRMPGRIKKSNSSMPRSIFGPV